MLKGKEDFSPLLMERITQAEFYKDTYRKLSFNFTGLYQTCKLNRSKMIRRIDSNENIF